MIGRGLRLKCFNLRPMLFDIINLDNKNIYFICDFYISTLQDIGVFPICVGIFRKLTNTWTATHGVPHMCGDIPFRVA